MDGMIRFDDVNQRIMTLRNERVILDCDVAELYGVETREINQAIRNNPDKFPEGYVIEASSNEFQILKSKILISSWGGSRKPHKAFTEKGLYMLATILKSPLATQTTIAIVEAFAKIRELSREVVELVNDHTNNEKQKAVTQKGSELLSSIIGKDLETVSTETSFELNLFAAMKIKHSVKRSGRRHPPQNPTPANGTG